MHYLIIVKAATYFNDIGNKEMEYNQHMNEHRKKKEAIEMASNAFKTEPLEVSYDEFKKLYHFFDYNYNIHKLSKNAITSRLRYMSQRLPKAINSLEERYNKGNDNTKFKTRSKLYGYLYKSLKIMLDAD
ncbi:hypothetical protein ECANGB1_173 [Enterospora canceri]|uniref:Uncharacterized protein n=1 Tax=Enterospora canceri TaxID=1081671 RepID=A0A1Y1S4K6_9MICR|nr:hypothetical protein ECANGB1_173 [Enterospora canceri]